MGQHRADQHALDSGVEVTFVGERLPGSYDPPEGIGSILSRDVESYAARLRLVGYRRRKDLEDRRTPQCRDGPLAFELGAHDHVRSHRNVLPGQQPSRLEFGQC
jgi:hypothetical protein